MLIVMLIRYARFLEKRSARAKRKAGFRVEIPDIAIRFRLAAHVEVIQKPEIQMFGLRR
jgi:hypothetical protein